MYIVLSNESNYLQKFPYVDRIMRQLIKKDEITAQVSQRAEFPEY